MKLWVDAHLSPPIARWINANFPVTAFPLRELGLRDAEDEEIFAAARQANRMPRSKNYLEDSLPPL